MQESEQSSHFNNRFSYILLLLHIPVSSYVPEGQESEQFVPLKNFPPVQAEHIEFGHSLQNGSIFAQSIIL